MLKIALLCILFITGCIQADRGIQVMPTQSAKNKNITKISKLFGDYYALLIYVDDYTNLPKLETPKHDIEVIANILKSRYGFKETKIISNPRNNDELVAVLDSYGQKIKRKDNLLIYYAGHGSFEKRMKEGFWQLKDAKERSRVGWISIKSAINNTLNIINARHILVISDSCYSGAIFRKGGASLPHNRDDIRYYKEIYQKKSRTALTSGGLEPVLDGSPLNPNNSIFSNALLSTLEKNKKSIFSLEEKFPEIKRYIKLKADQTPEYSDISKTGHEMGGDFIFVDNSLPLSLPLPLNFTPSKNPSQPTKGVKVRGDISFYIKEANRFKKEENRAKAMEFYLKACNLKSGVGCMGLGVLYQKQNDNKNTIKYLNKSCEYGHKNSCKMLTEGYTNLLSEQNQQKK